MWLTFKSPSTQTGGRLRKTKMRIALIVPKRRLGLWHERLTEHLSKEHRVAVFVDDRAPSYPLSLRIWLSIERLLHREQQGASSEFHAELIPFSDNFDESEFDVVIDLAERAEPRRKSISIRYNGFTDSTALVKQLLSRQIPHLTVCGQGTQDVLAESLPAIDDKSRLTRGLQVSFGRCISLVERALLQRGDDRIISHLAPAPKVSGGLLAYIGRFVAAKAAKVMFGKFASTRHWSVALRNQCDPFVLIAANRQRRYADPFLFRWRGRTFLFVEDYHCTTMKGVISAAEIIGDRLAAVPIPVLERPYHLSYPFVFADAEAIYMLPETTKNNVLELYRAVEFPWKWQPDSVLIKGMALADATPLFHQNRWWLFAAAAEHGTTDHDELFIFYSDQLAGPWRPHSKNPVKSDCRAARPAGRIVQNANRLFRPAQDCEETYGSGIVWHEIVELSPSHFREIEISRIRAPRALGIERFHSFDQVGQLQVVDVTCRRGVWRRPSAHGGMQRLANDLDSAIQTMAPGASNAAYDPGVMGVVRAAPVAHDLLSID